MDDATIELDERGDGDVIVLLHGFLLTRDIWSAQVDALARTHRVIALAGDVAALLDALRIERATIIGHSMGGYVALAFARMYAERVRRLALIGSTTAADTSERAQWREELARETEATNSIGPAFAFYSPRLFAPGAPTMLHERVAAIAHKNGPIGAAALLRGMAERSNAEDIAEDLEMPVLVVVGAHDALLPVSEAAGVAAAFKRGRLATCERSGHMPMLEEPERVNATLAAWLDEEG